MKDPVYERLREAAWRRKLTPAEEQTLQRWLAEHPNSTAEWDAEKDLTEALGRMPEAPVPSNFTARVLAAAQRQEPAAARGHSNWLHRWHGRLRWLPRVAVATVILAAGLLSYQHAQHSRRKERAESVRDMVSFTAFPGPEILQDYDAIQAMSQSPAADVELLKALQ